MSERMVKTRSGRTEPVESDHIPVDTAPLSEGPGADACVRRGIRTAERSAHA